MDLSLNIIIFLCLAFFIAGFIDSIAGGGGLITLPALLFFGIPPHFALGTNKMASTLGTGTAVVNFIKSKNVNYKLVAAGMIFSLLGSFFGSKTILLINQEIVGKLILFLLPLAIIAVFIPKNKEKNKAKLTAIDYFLIIPIICLLIGFYDGFFGPGTGSFLTLALVLSTKLNFLQASANAKVFNLLSNIGSFIAFIFCKKVLVLLAIPLAVSNMAGNYLGSKLAIKQGDKIVKYFLILSLALLSASLIWKYYF